MSPTEADNGWGATFHRHTFSNEIHRDGGAECTQQGTPRPVFVFDPDFLAEHDARIRAEAQIEALEYLGDRLAAAYWETSPDGVMAVRLTQERIETLRAEPHGGPDDEATDLAILRARTAAEAGEQ